MKQTIKYKKLKREFKVFLPKGTIFTSEDGEVALSMFGDMLVQLPLDVAEELFGKFETMIADMDILNQQKERN